MLKANEVRIGNWVNGPVSGYKEVTAKDIFLWESVKWEPIPLSPEVLEACGFVPFRTNNEMTLELANDLESNALNLTCYDKTATEIRVWVEASQRDDNYNPQFTSLLTPLLHLHQLQNLYYSLTGSELQVNLTQKV